MMAAAGAACSASATVADRKNERELVTNLFRSLVMNVV